mmetsp:Transcript_72905/g.218932  ORF Transcript_72905/g.218932 Transcript_72905/m.218932 type:complete len:215 (-) Transcript_72905:63-707(-)
MPRPRPRSAIPRPPARPPLPAPRPPLPLAAPETPAIVTLMSPALARAGDDLAAPAPAPAAPPGFLARASEMRAASVVFICLVSGFFLLFLPLVFAGAGVSISMPRAAAALAALAALPLSCAAATRLSLPPAASLAFGEALTAFASALPAIACPFPLPLLLLFLPLPPAAGFAAFAAFLFSAAFCRIRSSKLMSIPDMAAPECVRREIRAKETAV